jgi:hypothetical protein
MSISNDAGKGGWKSSTGSTLAPSQDAVKMDQWLHPYSVLIDMNKRR